MIGVCFGITSRKLLVAQNGEGRNGHAGGGGLRSSCGCLQSNRKLSYAESWDRRWWSSSGECPARKRRLVASLLLKQVFAELPLGGRALRLVVPLATRKVPRVPWVYDRSASSVDSMFARVELLGGHLSDQAGLDNTRQSIVVAKLPCLQASKALDIVYTDFAARDGLARSSIKAGQIRRQTQNP